jgi:aspartokinase
VGSTSDGRTTTLGRNGSDFTATLLGAGLRAECVVINTDVPGVMTADPSLEATAYPVKRLSYFEAMELSILVSNCIPPNFVTNRTKIFFILFFGTICFVRSDYNILCFHSQQGVSMFHPRSLFPLKNSNVPMLIRNTMKVRLLDFLNISRSFFLLFFSIVPSF